MRLSLSGASIQSTSRYSPGPLTCRDHFATPSCGWSAATVPSANPAKTEPCATRGRALPRMVKPPGGSRWNFHTLLPSLASTAVIDSSLDMTKRRPSEMVGVVVSSSCTSSCQRTAPVNRLSAVSLPSAAAR